MNFRYREAGYYSFSKDAATSAPMLSHFDYIVIGGGTAGCALAATLSQNATVLVLERGGSPYDNPTATDIGNFLHTFLNTTPNSWSQLFISEDGVFNSRARVLGGGTVLNAGFYSRAEDDYVAETGWVREEVAAAYEWVEKKLVFQPQIKGWQTAFIDGLLEVGVTPYNGFTYEHVHGTKVGGTIFDPDGRRHTAANLLEYADPQMITVYLHASVHKILFTTTGNMRPKANGVIFRDTNGVFHTAKLAAHSALNEVILSAGAIASPQLLMLSGVGPASHLADHGVEPVILDQPMVGQGMCDNPMNAVLIPSPEPVEVSLAQVAGIPHFGSYIEGGSGLSVSISLWHSFYGAVINLLNEMKLPTKTLSRFFKLLDLRVNVTTQAGRMVQKVDWPISRGHLELRNTNPDDNPSVTFNYYQEQEDLNNCVEGLSTIIKVIDSKKYSKYMFPGVTGRGLLDFILGLPINLRPRHINSLFDLKQYCKDTVMTIYHYHGGCQVGKVVDNDYKVLGIDALRVIDASTFLKTPGTNPQATIMMLGSFLRDATSAPTLSHYDYIVIGGGTAGCALAATLSQNATVLLLERGGSPYDNPLATDIGNFLNTFLNTTPNSWSQLFISEDGVFNSRARVLGGGTVINAGFYSRAEADFVAESGWDREEVEAAYEWVEKKLVFEPQIKGWQTAFIDGLLEAGVTPYNGFTYKHIYGTKVGGTILDPDGRRHTAADLLEYADPKKITVYLHASAHKILFTTTGTMRPKANGVIFQDANGVLHTAKLAAHNAQNEVLLSAGAIASPQLLLLSGVGPAAHLADHGVDPVILDHPMVGQGMGDNPMNAVVIPSPKPVEVSLVQVAGIPHFGSYIEGLSGLSLSISLTHSFFDGVINLLNEIKLPTKTLSNFFKLLDLRFNITTQAGGMIQKVYGPISRGHLELRNTNPDDNPSVTFNYYQEPEDLNNCVEGLSTIIKVINSQNYSKYKFPGVTGRGLLDLILALPINLRPRHINSLFDLKQYCKDTVMTIYHYHGGCQVGKVVDNDYKVLGVDALRVVDASTFLKTPGTNPQATIMMLGRYVGQKILRERADFLETKEEL
uniref:Glucose-methanol-choline oxidoreductase N-terminal domain-containing protein n=1 Tax=Brassica oleracea var. oleracea TaxID=109376 RepID=A0A0D3DTJ3_BRAOL